MCVNGPKVSLCSWNWLKPSPWLSVRLDDGLFIFEHANIEAVKVEDWWYRTDWAQARGKNLLLGQLLFFWYLVYFSFFLSFPFQYASCSLMGYSGGQRMQVLQFTGLNSFQLKMKGDHYCTYIAICYCNHFSVYGCWRIFPGTCVIVY